MENRAINLDIPHIPQKQWNAIKECLGIININTCQYKDIKKISKDAYNGIRHLGGFGIFRYNYNLGVYSDKLDYTNNTEEFLEEIDETEDSYEDLPLPLKNIEEQYGHMEPPTFKEIDRQLHLEKELKYSEVLKELKEIKEDLNFLKENLLYNNNKIKILQESYKDNIKEDIKNMIKQYTIITYGKNYKENLLLTSNAHMISLLNKKFDINIDELQIGFAKKYAENIKSHNNSEKLVKEEKLIPNKLVLIEKLGLLIDYYCIVKAELESVLVFAE